MRKKNKKIKKTESNYKKKKLKRPDLRMTVC